MSRLPPQTISIPSKKTAPTEDDYFHADNVIRAIREVGLDPLKMAGVPLMPSLAKEWREGKMTKAQFQDSLRKIGIMNGWC